MNWQLFGNTWVHPRLITIITRLVVIQETGTGDSSGTPGFHPRFICDICVADLVDLSTEVCFGFFFCFSSFCVLYAQCYQCLWIIPSVFLRFITQAHFTVIKCYINTHRIK